MQILIVPTCWESRPVLAALPGASPVRDMVVPAWQTGRLLVIETGAGPAQIAAALPRLEEIDPGAVWLFGWCGGLVAGLGAGDGVLAVETIPVVEGRPGDPVGHRPPEGVEREVRRAFESAGRRLVAGPVLSTSFMLKSDGQKRWGGATGAVAVEMEAARLSAWATERSIPFVHLRVVLDPLGSELPTARLPVDAHGHVPARAMILRAAVRPREWPAWVRLVWQAGAARRCMKATIRSLAVPGGPLDPMTRAVRT